MRLGCIFWLSEDNNCVPTATDPTYLLRNSVEGVDICCSSQKTFPENEEKHQPDVFDPPIDSTGQEENHIDPLKQMKIMSLMILKTTMNMEYI